MNIYVTTLLCTKAHTSLEQPPPGTSEHWEEIDGLDTRVISLLQDHRKTRKLNRKYEWVEPVDVEFTLAITGKIPRNYSIPTVAQAIRDAFNLNYGRDSEHRKFEVLVKDFYSIVSGTGYFGERGAYFEVSHSGLPGVPKLAEMVYIDLDNTTITLSYL